MREHRERIRFVRRQLALKRNLLAGDEYDERGLSAAVCAGAIVRVLRGCYMRAETWHAMRIDEQLLARTLAVARLRKQARPLFSHLSAAAIWGIPIYWTSRGQMERVHVTTSPARRGTSSAPVLQHLADVPDEDICEVEGLRVTSLARTVIDLARWAPAETAIGCADAGLRRLFGVTRDQDLGAVDEWRERELAMLGTMRGGRGVARARWLLRIADPRADSVAESVSRLHLVRLRVPHEIQVHVVGPDGENFWLDFFFVGQRTFGEMDGRVKFADPEFRRGRTLEQVLLDEREREVKVKGVTRNDVVRWGWAQTSTTRRFGRMLRGFGLDVPGLS
ncbi:hypothetical protein [Leucobacter celer]|uniref:hypothetical protein n=1 Tax=Leucobacter celer TaxID=668625 RepID=UPI0012FC7056|nr:hypothetical protein [Leucobacter celer]